MVLFFSRRTYNAATSKFTKNPAALTRYVMLNAAGSGGIISHQDWLAQVMAASQTGEVLIFVHGFNTSQSLMLERHGRIEAGLRAHGYRGAVVSFDWPSQGNIAGYGIDRNHAKQVARHLVPDGVLPILNQAPGVRVHVLAHSMGAYLTLRAFSGEGEAAGAAPWRADQVLFVAGDVEASALRSGAWGALVMELRCARLTNYYSVADKVLQLSEGILHGGEDRAGQAGLPDAPPGNAVDVYTTQQFRDHVPQARQGELEFSHIWLYEDAGFLRDAALTVAGTPDGVMPTRRNTNVGDRALLT